MRLVHMLATAAVAISMSSAPALAQAASPAAALSVSSAKAHSARVGAKLRGKSAQEATNFLVPVLVVGAVVLGALALTDDGDEAPTSP